MSEYLKTAYEKAMEIGKSGGPLYAGRMDDMLKKGNIDRPRFIEMRKQDMTYGKGLSARYNYVQIKYDGIWGNFVIADGKWLMYSRTGKIKASGKWPDKTHTACLIGEYIHGKHRIHPKGTFFAFDCLWRGKRDLRDLAYSVRLSHLRSEIDIIHSRIEYTEKLRSIEETYTFDRSEWEHVWETYVENEGYEGLILKDGRSMYDNDEANVRIKRTCEIEYMCIGFAEADPESKYAGQVGAVRGSLIDYPCDVKCGGLSEIQRTQFTMHPKEYIGKVFTAKGNGWYKSGSIRHPKFKYFRNDKTTDECTYEQIPEAIRAS